MSCSGPKSLIIGRPSKSAYDAASCGGPRTANPETCQGSACSPYTGPNDRRLSPRKFREKTREQIKDYVLLMLGAPTVKVELDTQGLDLCVDQALKVFEDYAGREYFDYYTFNTVPGKSVYKMPDDVGVIRNVFYMEQPNIASSMFQDLGGVLPLDYLYAGDASTMMGGGVMNPIQPMWGQAGAWTGYKMYEQMFNRISSRIGGWEWISDLGYIKLYPAPCGNQKAMVHYLQKCKDWREVTQAMQEGALAHAMIMLGHIRGKYQNPPGPGGGMQLDGDYMRTKGWELKDKWQEELISRYGDLLPISLD